MAMNTAPKPGDQNPVPTRLRDLYSECGHEIVSMDEIRQQQAELSFGADTVAILMNGRISLELDRPLWEQVKRDAARMGVTIAQFFDELFIIYTKLLTAKVSVPELK
jgi:hypothetical protein